MEHCGDDFLAALAESMQDTEDWDNDDFQAMESEACGNLADMLENDVHVPIDNYDGASVDINSGSHIHVIEDSPKPRGRGRQNLRQLDSSSNGEEDEDLVVLSEMNRKAAKNSSSQAIGKRSREPSSISEVFLYSMI